MHLLTSCSKIPYWIIAHCSRLQTSHNPKSSPLPACHTCGNELLLFIIEKRMVSRHHSLFASKRPFDNLPKRQWLYNFICREMISDGAQNAFRISCREGICPIFLRFDCKPWDPFAFEDHRRNDQINLIPRDLIEIAHVFSLKNSNPLSPIMILPYVGIPMKAVPSTTNSDFVLIDWTIFRHPFKLILNDFLLMETTRSVLQTRLQLQKSPVHALNAIASPETCV